MPRLSLRPDLTSKQSAADRDDIELENVGTALSRAVKRQIAVLLPTAMSRGADRTEAAPEGVVAQQCGELVYELVPLGVETPDSLPGVLRNHHAAVVQALARGRMARKQITKETRDKWAGLLSQARQIMKIDNEAPRKRCPMERLKFYVHRAVSEFLDSPQTAQILPQEVVKERDEAKRGMGLQRTMSGMMKHFWTKEDAASLLTRFRGTEGETVGHLCCLQMHDPIHKLLLKILVDLYPSLLDTTYTKRLYKGETLLHMAIVKKDKEMVDFFLDRGARVDIPVEGDFFTPKEVFDLPIFGEVPSGCRYWGQYPLHFAALTGEFDMVKAILRHENKDTSPALQSVLHSLVFCGSKFPMDGIGNSMEPDHSKPLAKRIQAEMLKNELAFFEMYSLLVDNGANEGVDEEGWDMVWSGISPFVLAAKLARKKMFFRFLETKKRKYWDYGPVVCYGYPLENLDTVLPDGRLDRNSALQIIVDRALDSEKHLNMLDGMLLRLLDNKYLKVRMYFYLSVLLHVSYVALITLVVLLRPEEKAWEINNNVDAVRLVMEVAIVVLTMFTAVEEYMQISDVTHLYFHGNERILTCVRQYFAGTGIMSVLRMICIVCVGTGVVMRVAHDDAERESLALAAMCAWSYSLYLLRAVPFVGPLVIMLCQIMIRDIFPFLAIYVIFLMGSSLGYYVLFADVDTSDILDGDIANGVEQFSTLPKTLATLFHLMWTWEIDYSVYDEASVPQVAKFLYVVYITFFAIIMLNILIAMMNNTYKKIEKYADRETLREKAKIIMMLESSYILQESRRRLFREYAQTWPPATQSEVTAMSPNATLGSSFRDFLYSMCHCFRRKNKYEVQLTQEEERNMTDTDDTSRDGNTEWMMLIEEEVSARREDTLLMMDESELATIVLHRLKRMRADKELNEGVWYTEGNQIDGDRQDVDDDE
eukprot:Rmarinus@m.15303